MGQGKYSPNYPAPLSPSEDHFGFNCYGQKPDPWNEEVSRTTQHDEKVHFGNYDAQGFDSYGYSAFDLGGNYVGIGNGVDRNGLTEHDYMSMSEEQFDEYR